MKPSFASSGVSSWRSLCRMEVTVRLWSKWGVFATLPTVLAVWHPLKQLLQTEADSFRWMDVKWAEAHIWFSSEMAVMFDLMLKISHWKVDLTLLRVSVSLEPGVGPTGMLKWDVFFRSNTSSTPLAAKLISFFSSFMSAHLKPWKILAQRGWFYVYVQFVGSHSGISFH